MSKQPFWLLMAAWAAFAPAGATKQVTAAEQRWRTVDNFERADSFYHGHGWESLNPGFWKIHNKALRRRLEDRGSAFTQWAPSYWFP